MRLPLVLATAVAVALTTVAPAPAMSPPPPRVAVAPLPLAGVTIVVDPGHQLGNAGHPDEINQPVDAGGFTKPCNTTGTATNAGYPEATFAFRVSRRLRDRLEALGATVLMTRHRNSRDLWGPCVDVRGRLGDKGFRGRTANADLKISVHGDGAAAGDHGFHIIVASKKQSRRASLRYARATRRTLQGAGFVRSTYVGGGTALDLRGDLGTLNLSRFPTIMVELGNMRNAGDAGVMSSTKGQRRYARALTRGIRHYLHQ